MELQDLSDSVTKEQQKKNTVFNEDKHKTVGCGAPLVICGILALPVLGIFGNTLYYKAKAKKHPNIVKEVFADYIKIQDVHDNEERLVAKRVIPDVSVADYFYSGDTVYFYDKEYEKRLVFQQGKMIYNEDTIKARKEREKMQQIINSSNIKQR